MFSTFLRFEIFIKGKKLLIQSKFDFLRSKIFKISLKQYQEFETLSDILLRYSDQCNANLSALPWHSASIDLTALTISSAEIMGEYKGII